MLTASHIKIDMSPARPRNLVAFLCIAGSLAVPSLAQMAPIVIRSNTQDTTIWAQERPSAPASNAAITLQSHSGSGVAAATSAAQGDSVQANQHLVSQPATILTSGELPCEIENKTWLQSGSSCSAALPRTYSGSSGTATDANGADGATGQAIYACSNGVWAASPTSSNCIPTTCAASTLQWSASPVCAASVGQAVNGQGVSLANTVAGATGAASYTCVSGAWQLAPGATCSAALRGCRTPGGGGLTSVVTAYAANARSNTSINNTYALIGTTAVSSVAHGQSFTMRSVGTPWASLDYSCNNGTLVRGGVSNGNTSFRQIGCQFSNSTGVYMCGPATINSPL